MVSGRRSITLRSVLLSIALVSIATCMNAYLGINFGMGFGLGAITVIIAYALFSKLMGGTWRSEISSVLIASSSMLTAHYTLGFLIYLIENEPQASLPSWLVPSRDVILGKILDLKYWIGPLSFIILALLLSTIVGLIFSLILSDEFIRSKKMVFPFTAISASLIDSCFKGGVVAKIVGYSALAGFIITLIQYLTKFIGLDLTSIDLTPMLPEGFAFAISLSIGFMAVGYVMSAKVSLSLLFSGLFTYLVLAPILVSYGVIKPAKTAMDFYNNLVFNFTISPALGIMILGGFGLSILLFIRSRLSGSRGGGELGYAHLYKVLFKGLIENKRYLLILVSIAIAVHVLAYFLNPLNPLPPITSLLFMAYAFFIASFIEFVIITKMAGETGMSMGFASMLLYDMPIFLTGYRGYAAYWVLPLLRPSPWVGSGVICYLKYRREFDVDAKDVVKAKFIGWIPSLILSIIVVIFIWKFIGFGNEVMPAISFLQLRFYYKMLATGNIAGTVDPFLFIGGGIAGALIELLTPASMIGVAMGMLLPPHYILPFGLGGLLRLYTDRRFGSEFFKEKGRLIAAGVMTSSILIQVLMSIVTAKL